MNVIYYYYYLFYTKVLPDDQPHSTVIYTLGFTLGLIVNFAIDLVLSIIFKIHQSKWTMIGVAGFIILILYLHYYRSGKGFKVIVEKPMFKNSHKLSIAITLMVFFLGLISMFMEAFLIKYIIELK
jgi:hypothetical protein